MQGTVKGVRRESRQKKRWEDNIREWTGLEFGRSQRAVENRKKWRKLVAKSSVAVSYTHLRSLGPAKTISHGTVKWGRRRDRQRKKWEDNTREWIGLEFAKSQRAVENREKWRRLVVKSSMVP